MSERGDKEFVNDIKEAASFQNRRNMKL